jgi:hypothetical protein
MKPEIEKNISHPSTRNLTYHSLDDNALETITFDRVIFLNKHAEEISKDVGFLTSQVEKSACSDLKIDRKTIAGAREFIEKLSPLNQFDMNASFHLGEFINGLKKGGITHFLDSCFTENIDPLLAITYQALNHGRKPKDLDIDMLKKLSIKMDENPALNKFLNHAAIIAARELGLINQNESLILRSLQENLQTQNFEVHGLSTLLRHALFLSTKLNTTSLRKAGTYDEEITALLKGGSLVGFSRKLYELRGHTEIQGNLDLPQVKDLNWDRKVTKGSSSRSNNRG